MTCLAFVSFAEDELWIFFTVGLNQVNFFLILLLKVKPSKAHVTNLQTSSQHNPLSLKAVSSKSQMLQKYVYSESFSQHLKQINFIDSLGLFVLPQLSNQVGTMPQPCSCLNSAIITNMGDTELTATHRRKMNANGMLSLYTGLGCSPSVISQQRLSLLGT